jgi:XTP/dITP diphosphohydrolase
MRIFLATQNKGKLKEVKEIFSNDEILLPENFLEIEEGNDYLSNAKLKAKTYAEKFHQIFLADDSGLEIDSLGDLPGPKSSRFFESFDYKYKMNKILELLSGVENRKAKYVCYAAIYSPFEGKFYTSRGYVYGRIAESIRGDKGFGYDPIFIPEGYDKTFGELGNDIKNKISHRSKALKSLSCSFFLSKEIYDKLMETAFKYQQNSYAKYSHFHVGAAVLSDNEIYGGCNVENSAYGSSMCAERVAIFKAISEGHKKINAVVIVGETNKPISPCGSCRQVISEFANEDTPIIMVSKNKDVKVEPFKNILPYSFDLEG